LKQGTSFLIPPTIAECKQELRKAQIEVSRIARESAQYREDEITSKVATLESEGNTKRQSTQEYSKGGRNEEIIF
jgi:hypothetical protein